MAKKVTVKSGTVYTTLGAGQAYFDALREGRPLRANSQILIGQMCSTYTIVIANSIAGMER